jgi:xanthine dehydrogenase large subunit
VIKRGLALTPVKFGISFTATLPTTRPARWCIYPDGTVQLNHGGTEMGQGLHTKMLVVARTSSACRSARARMMSRRPTRCPNTSATAASAAPT